METVTSTLVSPKTWRQLTLDSADPLTDCTLIQFWWSFLLGGTNELDQLPVPQFRKGLVGCISELSVGKIYSLDLLKRAKNGRNVDSCRNTFGDFWISRPFSSGLRINQLTKWCKQRVAPSSFSQWYYKRHIRITPKIICLYKQNYTRDISNYTIVNKQL